GRRGGGGRRKGLLVGGGVIGLAAVAGGAFAVYQVVFATGPQPAEALPDTTVGYVSVDLDPSGKQKLEALDALEKFPAFNDNVDVDSDDDLREKFFDYVQDQGGCAGLSFEDDVEPWLGDRYGFAAVDVGEKLAPDSIGIAPVGVIQVKDEDKADAGLEKLLACEDDSDSASSSSSGSGSSSDGDDSSSSSSDDLEPLTPEGEEADESTQGGWSFQGDWVVIAENTEIAEAVTDAAADHPLSEDDDYQKWTEATGDAGILTAYAAPDAGKFLAEAFNDFGGGGITECYGSAEAQPAEPSSSAVPEDDYADDFSEDFESDFESDCSEESSGDDEATQALEDAFAGFDGAAVTVRFDDGGLEIESASSVDYLGLEKVYSSERGDDVVAGFPDDTAIAVGVGFEEGWFTSLTDYLDSVGGDMFDLEEGIAALEEETGLQLPEDAETLAGESAAIAIGGDFDPEAFDDGDPSGQPVAVKVKGDPDGITSIIDRLLDNPDVAAEVKDEFGYQTDDDHVVAGFSEDYNKQLLEDGGLGDSDTYQDVVRESDKSAAVLYVNFDAGGWLDRAVAADGGDPEVAANVKPLKALGLSAWTDDDDVSHSVFRITTN
ncbi:DUF3352 domain-containing protein, partial [Nocardioides sp.]|uniref:DUF3352 domain-containing protein n=1 Tax=Nocardioides sp. TaxID=35761 RepID=UPI0027174CF2